MLSTDIVDRVIKLSQRNDLADDKPTILYYINKVKLELLRDRRYRFNQATTELQLKANKRTVDIPANFLHSPVIRRGKATATGSDGISKQQFLAKYIDKTSFENDYPQFDENNNQLVGTSNAFILWGTSIFFGNIPNVNETLYCDYYCYLKDYDLTGNKEDVISIKAYDYLIAGAIEEIYTSWVVSDKLKALWNGEKLKALKSLKKLQVFEEAGFGYDLEMEEPS